MSFVGVVVGDGGGLTFAGARETAQLVRIAIEQKLV
jgi:hypothetical protein